MSELKPCPFCGSDHIEFVLVSTISTGNMFAVKCQFCWAKSVYVYKHNKQEAIEAWNIRYEEEQVEADPREVGEKDE